MFNWLADKIGLKELRERLDKLEDRVSNLEKTTSFILGDFGEYKKRSEGELKIMEVQVSKLLDQIDNVIDTLNSEEGITRAKALRARLRNNHTRIKNARVA